MNGDACVSRHVRLVVMYRRFTVRDKQGGVWPVSYTHLDVYKRQIHTSFFTVQQGF